MGNGGDPGAYNQFTVTTPIRVTALCSAEIEINPGAVADEGPVTVYISRLRRINEDQNPPPVAGAEIDPPTDGDASRIGGSAGYVLPQVPIQPVLLIPGDYTIYYNRTYGNPLYRKIPMTDRTTPQSLKGFDDEIPLQE